MNLKNIINGGAMLLSMALVAQAATPTILDWQFANNADPAAPTTGAGSETVNNTGGEATLDISGTIQTYYFNARAGFGTERGMWDTLNGQYTLTIQAGSTTPGQTLGYTLRVYQFFDSAGGVFPGLMNFSLGTPLTSSRQVIDSTPDLGVWVEDTFTWNVTPSDILTPLSLTITADTSTPGTTGELFFDRVRWDIIGDIAVPEPHTAAITMLGLIAFGVRSWFRRKV